ncbi:MAG: hypothetical protein JNM09_30675, partial [Blastocatellia bacterium]|nr:hypothetical protein [Blastocatellia bacterium]
WIRDLKKEDFECAENVVQELSEILAFACASQIRKYGYKYAEVTPSERYHSMTPGVAHSFRPIIWSDSHDVVKEFIEKIWPKYHKLRDERQLHIVIDYLALTQMEGIPQELELMMSFATLENLKSTYARSVGIPFIKPRFRKISSPPKSNPQKEPPYNFEELLTLMLSPTGINCSLDKVIKLRNEIVHSGISELSFEEQREILNVSQDLIREYLLRLLGFTGKYQAYSQPRGRYAPLSI